MASKLFSSDKIRNVAVVGHSSTGKTTLISTILFNAKDVDWALRNVSSRMRQAGVTRFVSAPRVWAG